MKVAKHGNRALTSKCGSADVLAELGVTLELTPENVGRCVDECGIGFLFAPGFARCHEIRGTTSPRDWYSHGIQRTGSSDKSGWCKASGDGCI